MHYPCYSALWHFYYLKSWYLLAQSLRLYRQHYHATLGLQKELERTPHHHSEVLVQPVGQGFAKDLSIQRPEPAEC